MRLIGFVLSLLFLLFVLDSSIAYAYLDPGTGSIILQILLGGTVGVFAILKLYWSRIRSLFGVQDAAEDGEVRDIEAK